MTSPHPHKRPGRPRIQRPAENIVQQILNLTGMTVIDLALELGIARSTISRWLKNPAMPKTKQMKLESCLNQLKKKV